MWGEGIVCGMRGRVCEVMWEGRVYGTNGEFNPRASPEDECYLL